MRRVWHGWCAKNQYIKKRYPNDQYVASISARIYKTKRYASCIWGKENVTRVTLIIEVK